MRIIVMSDSHGSFGQVRRIFEDNPGADCFIHLGDGAKDFEEAGWLFPDTLRKGIRGNCDFGHSPDTPKELLLEMGDKRIFCTHGDLYRVKYGMEDLRRAGRERQADIVLYGHTHRALAEYLEGVWYLNPGSVWDSSHTPAGYLALDITPAGVVPVLRKL